VRARALPVAAALGAALLGPCALGGCALGPGEPFGALEAHLEAGLDAAGPGDWRDAGDGYQVRLDELALTAGAVELVDLGGPAAAFDPARPPPGYSGCHGGHCHAEDGRLVSYEEIAAERSGGQASVVAALPVGALDLIAGEARALDCEPSCDLPRAQIGLLRLPVTELEARGLVRDTREPPRVAGEAPFALDLHLEHEPVSLLGHEVDLPVDRDHPPAIELAAGLELTAALLAEVRWDELPRARGALEVHGDEESTHAVEHALAEVELSVAVARGGL